MYHAPRQEVGTRGGSRLAKPAPTRSHHALLTDDRVGGCHTRRQDVSDPLDGAGNSFAFQTRGRSRPVCGPEVGIAGGTERRPTTREDDRASARKCKHA